ncbi:YigZ family protein [Zhihengliuella sp.]|uniref:IMPACT family protein n=1 Tax=Zhihengliuella sp. TaxID=1954483 RepID=UPI0028118CD3|nr:YigZ family protein [Zhihengliuella sp.]
MNDQESRATQYTTIAEDVVHELEIKRSRFICHLRRVETEEAARGLLAELRRSHFDARHHCNAFILGADRDVRRSSDDGEPSGTAGAPMLEALARRTTRDGATDLSDVVAVVVRYFGGVLLGAGGLVRAYSESVSAALDAAALVQRQRMRLVRVETELSSTPRLENDLRVLTGTDAPEVLGTDYGADGASVHVALPDAPGALEAFAGRLATLTAGTGRLTAGGVDWVDRPAAGPGR